MSLRYKRKVVEDVIATNVEPARWTNFWISSDDRGLSRLKLSGAYPKFLAGPIRKLDGLR